MSSDENQENCPDEYVENYLRYQGLWDVVSGAFASLWDVVSRAFARPADGSRRMSSHENQENCADESISEMSLDMSREMFSDAFARPAEEYLQVLMQQIYADDLEGVKETLDQHKDALTASLDSAGQTPLHAAARSGHLRIVKELITRLQPEDLLKPDSDGYTPLSNAAYVGVGIDVSTAIFEANRDTLITPEYDNFLPVTLAFSHGHTLLGVHLYTATVAHLRLPDHTLRIHNLPNGRALGANLLGSCFISQQLGIALDFLSIPGNQYLLLEKDNDGKSAIERIATLRGMDTDVATELLNKVCESMSILAGDTGTAATGLFLATSEGNIEFVKRLSKAYPTLITLCSPINWWNIFFYAVAHRQAMIFDHIRVLRLKDMLASTRDSKGNTLLHIAAKLDTPAKLKLDRITGPALQMQRELQWFKEVETVVPNWVKEHKNDDNLTPRELFKKTHKELRKEGEEWMKGAANSGSVAAGLIVTIMFTAAFTIPGGFDSNSGSPLLREKQRKWLMTFIFADVISLLFFIASVLTFLTILTSRFDEEDFLMSLPTKLICGFSALLVSIITMFIAFYANIGMVLDKTSYLWVYPPFILVVLVIFSWLQYSSFVEMVSSTYFPRIFDKEVKPWLRNIFNEERDPRAIAEGNDLKQINPGLSPIPV